MLTSVAQFLPVRSGQPSDNQPNPDQPVARPDLYIPYKRINPYQEMNTLTARVSGLPKLTVAITVSRFRQRMILAS